MIVGHFLEQVGALHGFRHKNSLSDYVTQCHFFGQVAANVFEKIFNICDTDDIVGIVVIYRDS